jgi:hypothetical protein
MKRKKAREEKRDKLSKEIASITDEERLARRAAIAAETAARDEHLATALREAPRIGIDLSYCNEEEESANSSQETTSLAKQLNYVYASLRRREISIQLHFTSFKGRAAEALGKGGANGWQVHRHAKPLEEVFKLEDVVYLTPDAEVSVALVMCALAASSLSCSRVLYAAGSLCAGGARRARSEQSLRRGRHRRPYAKQRAIEGQGCQASGGCGPAASGAPRRC